ncbi:hypothetical protein GSY71_10185 [Pusillimonas sp. TS35]|nr:hypothetical protein [Pusillimonas sp. TS35]
MRCAAGLCPRPVVQARLPAAYRRGARACVLAALTLALTACAFPRKDFSGVPDPGVIRVEQSGPGFRAVAPDCNKLLQPSQYNKADDLRMSIAFGCATYSNLAEQVARPDDLVRPRTYRGQSGDTAGEAVKRYREGEVTPLRETRSTDVGAKGGK